MKVSNWCNTNGTDEFTSLEEARLHLIEAVYSGDKDDEDFHKTSPFSEVRIMQPGIVPGKLNNYIKVII